MGRPPPARVDPPRCRVHRAGVEHEEPIAGPGCPLVAEFCIAELGTVLGISTTAAKKLIGHALELRHRLPRLWAQVHAGAVPTWRARLGRRGHDPLLPGADRRSRAGGSTPRSLPSPVGSAPRSSTGWSRRPSSATTSLLWIRLRIRRTATCRSTPATSPSTRTTSTSPAPCTSRPTSTSPTPSTSTKRSPMVLRRRRRSGRPRRSTYAAPRPSATSPAPRPRWTCSAKAPPAPPTRTACRPPGRSSSTPTSTRRSSASRRCSVPPDGWSRASGWSCSTSSRPGAATPAPRSPSSPSSTSPPSSPHRRTTSPTGSANRSSCATARACSRGAPAPPGAATSTTSIEFDHDAEAEGRPQPGPTTTLNLAALCRYHHRLKTLTTWHYRMVGPGIFEWTSPHGHRYRRDRTGTTRIDDAEPPDPPGRP